MPYFSTELFSDQKFFGFFFKLLSRFWVVQKKIAL